MVTALIAVNTTPGPSAATAQIAFERALSVNGAVFNGTTDDSAAIQSALNIFSTAYLGDVTFPSGPGISTKINTGLTVIAGICEIDFNACKIDASGVASGYALTINAPTIVSASIFEAVKPLRNLYLAGPATTSTTISGVFIDRGTATQVSGLSMYDCWVTGFQDCLILNNYVYINQFYNFNAIAANRYGINLSGTVSTGENINFHGGRVANCVNSNNAIGVYMPSTAGSTDVFMHSVSLDYNDQQYNVAGGSLNLIGCHLENNNTTNPMGIQSWTTGNATLVVLDGCTITPTEAAGSSRPNLFTVSTGDARCAMRVRSNFLTYGFSGTLINVPNAGADVSMDGSRVEFAGATSSQFPTIGTYLNRLNNPGFETGALTGWSTNGTGITWTADNTTPHSGTYALKMVSTAAGNGSAGQTVPCKGGQVLYLRAWVDVTAYTSGTIYHRIVFYSDSALTQAVGSPVIINSWNAITGGYVVSQARETVPQGSNYVSVQVYSLNSAATVFFDDFECHVF